ncbi:DUF4870 domain-containing protein [Engelhardtia mirabilis]|uniref:DUF4870 domain-containing protein n=1 Tax=Engelhardtia mirabilis TaxID=2528011 RepID=A0A518BPW8_9BACT|nr:hypothetical protein Pla133_41340 [Planctomycetes bacterium Pla133]QDV03345.1 hypothetical protein Pla86_41330 [Planctomycetes bacterium Pla86]
MSTSSNHSNADTAPLTSEQRTLSCLAHLSTFAGGIVPFGNVIAPLVIWLVQRDESPFVAEHARQALNFQITMMVLGFVSLAVVVATLGLAVFVVAPVLIVVTMLGLVFTVIAAVRGYEGREYRYPLSLAWV